jgi:hypothetical protein
VHVCACAHVYKCEFDVHARTLKLWLGSQSVVVECQSTTVAPEINEK